MIAVDPSTIGTWAERRGVTYTSYMDLSQRPEVRDLIRDGGRQVQPATLPDRIRVRRFLLLAKELDADDAEITRTRKVRRQYVAEKYAAVIEALYSGKDETELATTVTYEDGRQATIRSRVQMVDVSPTAQAQSMFDWRFLAAAGIQRRPAWADVRADRAGLRAGLQGHRRDQLRPGRVRDDRRLRGGGGDGSLWRPVVAGPRASVSRHGGFGFGLERVVLRPLSAVRSSP